MHQRRAVLPSGMLALLAAFGLGACGGSTEPIATATPRAPATVTATAADAAAAPTPATPTPSPTPAPGEPDGVHPPSLISNVRVEALLPDEVAVSFDYHLELAPEQNAFVHQGLLPVLGLTLLAADGDAIARVGDDLAPTEFGVNTAGGLASFVFATTRFADISAVHICIRVWTGGGTFGLHDELCEAFDFERIE